MNYTTPRRRHSSLFDRMENEIKKISKRLSAAKDSYRESSQPKKQFKSFGSFEDKSIPTVRRNKVNVKAEEPLTEHMKCMTAPLKRRYSNLVAPTPMETLELNPTFGDHSNINKIIIKLQDENSRLSYKLGRSETLCEQQSYRMGHLKAELKETNRKLDQERQKQEKQNCYLSTLLEHYRSKAIKYKRMLRGDEISEVSLESLSESQA